MQEKQAQREISSAAGRQSGAAARQSSYSEYDVPVLIYILKGVQNKRDAKSVPELAQDMKSILGDRYSERTLRRSLDTLLEIHAWKQEKDPAKKRLKRRLHRVLCRIYGGQVKAVSLYVIKEKQRSRTAKNSQKRYYFAPLLDDASMEMLNGTVISNQFLSEEEKDRLLSRMKVLNLLEDFFALPEEDEEEEEAWEDSVSGEDGDLADMAAEAGDAGLAGEEGAGELFPGNSGLFLKNIAKLHEAILQGWQIEMRYGIYDARDGRVIFRPRQEGGKVKRYFLNPYALFWNGGHYYLLATYAKGYAPAYMKEEGTPIHFRADRVLGVSFVKDAGAKKSGKYKEREPVPPRLKPFLRYDIASADAVEGRLHFSAGRYARHFPAMRISERKEPITCRLECSSWSLQILVDAFGRRMEIRKRLGSPQEGERDYNGRAQRFLEVRIREVEFENARDFCLMHAEYITPLHPPKLVQAVREKLEKSIQKLKQI